MEESRRHIRLGLFVVTSLSILVAALGALGFRKWFQPTFTFETYFDKSIAGLELGAPARFRGVPLGQVTEIVTSVAAYEQNRPIGERRDYIVVRVKAAMPSAEAKQMTRDIATMIGRGLRAQTQLAGITGQQYLELDFLDPSRHPPLPFSWKPKYTYLPSAPSVAGEIIAKAQSFLASLDEAHVSALARNLNTLVVNVDAKLGELRVGELSKNAERALRSVDAAATRLESILADPALGQTLGNSAKITARLRKLADDGDFDRLITGVDDAAERLDAMLGENQYDVRVIVQDLRSTADNLRVVSETIKRDPAVVLFGRPPDKVLLPKSHP
jgi:ABC-type transporter Mla subunit MlaD